VCDYVGLHTSLSLSVCVDVIHRGLKAALCKHLALVDLRAARKSPRSAKISATWWPSTRWVAVQMWWLCAPLCHVYEHCASSGTEFFKPQGVCCHITHTPNTHTRTCTHAPAHAYIHHRPRSERRPGRRRTRGLLPRSSSSRPLPPPSLVVCSTGDLRVVGFVSSYLYEPMCKQVSSPNEKQSRTDKCGRSQPTRAPKKLGHFDFSRENHCVWGLFSQLPVRQHPSLGCGQLETGHASPVSSVRWVQWASNRMYVVCAKAAPKGARAGQCCRLLGCARAQLTVAHCLYSPFSFSPADKVVGGLSCATLALPPPLLLLLLLLLLPLLLVAPLCLWISANLHWRL